MHQIKQRLAVVLVVGVLAACGGGDDEPAGSDDTTATSDDASGDASEDTSGEDTSGEDTSGDDASGDDTSDDSSTGNDSDDDMIVIDDFDDIPDECVDLMAEFLREIEPAVSDIDWENVTIAELDEMGSALDVPTEEFDRRTQESGCDRYDIGADTDQSLEFAIRVAEREAPGTVGWLQFISDMSAVGDDVTGGDDGDDAAGADLPGDCDAAKQLLIDKADEYGTFNNVPAGELGTLMTTIGNLTQLCTVGELEELYQDPAIQAFLEG